MLTYWKITFTIALVAVLFGAVDRWTRFNTSTAAVLFGFAFVVFVAHGLWALAYNK